MEKESADRMASMGREDMPMPILRSSLLLVRRAPPGEPVGLTFRPGMMFIVEQLQVQYFPPGHVREAIAVPSAAATAIGLQQVGEIGFCVRRVPELDDLFQDMGKLLIKHLRVLAWVALRRLQDDFSTDHYSSSLSSDCSWAEPELREA